jgi:spore maturation protein CgeB
MKLVLFGLTVSSSWGNGHATILRGLLRELNRRGHEIVFFERDVPYYASHRDTCSPAGVSLRLYPDWQTVLPLARRDLAEADVAMVTSYCPDALAATALLQEAGRGLRVFYDLDTPVTLRRLHQGEAVGYIGPRGLADFDLVLSYTGGRALSALVKELGARAVAPLYGCVDPASHFPVAAVDSFRADLSYLGTFALDRQAKLQALLIDTARALPRQKFLIGGSQYPPNFPWSPNIFFIDHVAPPQHPAFYCSSSFTLNVTREAMAAMGYCPSGRLFEAAACGVPLISDAWPGLEQFYKPGEEILVTGVSAGVMAALAMSPAAAAAMAARARQRTLEEHTAARRAQSLERILEGAFSSRRKERGSTGGGGNIEYRI